ncbi:DDE_3 domain-containing protein [Trichonephila clavipes]|nr:DDE_3 domain-containing protein [Trichonephila clavipes]
MERTRNLLPAHQYLRNGPLRQRRADGLSRHHTGCLHSPPLESYVRFLTNVAYPDFTLMDDNAKPHRALLVGEFLEREGICRINWSIRSPDLIPKEHAREALGRAIATSNLPQRTIQSLKTGLLNEWD